MKLRTSIVTAVLAGMCLSFTSTRATSSPPRADVCEAPRAGANASPIEIASSVAEVAEVAEPEIETSLPPASASPPDSHGATQAPASAHPGSYTLAETTSWMHIDPELAPSPWAGESALDRPEVLARAMKMYTRPIADSTSSASLSTAGFGSEASADGVDVRVATVGHGEGEASGAALGPRAVGVAANGAERAHRAASVSLRDVDVSMTRGIPRAMVQAIVRQNFAQLSTCYAPSLTTTPNLRGRVVVRFVIGQDGSVEVAQDAGSDLPNAAVVNCVVRRFLLLTFPHPEDGKVTVIYPLVFAPEETPQ